MLTSDEIAEMRTTANLTLTETVVVKRKTRSSDSAGGFTVSTATAATTTGRVTPATNAGIQVYAQRIGERQAYIVNLPAGTDVREDDQVVIGGVTYEVLGLLTGSWEIVRQCVCVRLE